MGEWAILVSLIIKGGYGVYVLCAFGTTQCKKNKHGLTITHPLLGISLVRDVIRNVHDGDFPWP